MGTVHSCPPIDSIHRACVKEIPTYRLKHDEFHALAAEMHVR